MSLGKLLATGRSLMASQGGAHRYRANKRVALPKFGSLKNPFASGAQQERAEARPTAAVPTEAKVRATNASASPAALRKPVPVRLPKWASGWSAKLNPFAIWRRRRATGLETTDAGTSAVPVQRELSLESVRVVCNDLTDADAEASGKGKRANPAAESGMRGMTAKAEVAMDRLSAKLFGSVDA